MIVRRHQLGTNEVKEKICFIDFEASSLDPNLSFPTEFGWAFEDGSGHSLLINPHGSWINDEQISDLSGPWPGWNEGGVLSTGITREMIACQGLAPATVAKRFLDATDGCAYYADNPDWDGMWMDKLFAAAEMDPAPRVRDYNHLIGPYVAGAVGQATLLLAQGRANESVPRTHRAGDDARHLAEVYRNLLKDGLGDP